MAGAEARFFFNSDHSKDGLVYEMTAAEFKTVVDAVQYDEVVYRKGAGHNSPRPMLWSEPTRH